MYWILSSLIIGLFAGAIAGRIVKGRGFGCLGNIIVGLIGGFLGGWLFNQLNFSVHIGFWGSLLTSTVGAVVFLAAVNLIFGGDRK
ncbi:MAG: GlsB/YeaQ/YmgE family stress response membrane protein [Anaerolineae bacterium]|nr:GlsB/YeaQ/YmgE family stress response membrane protein [Anaerolineae bacterium]